MRIDDGDGQVPTPPDLCPICKTRHAPGTPHQDTKPPEDGEPIP